MITVLAIDGRGYLVRHWFGHDLRKAKLVIEHWTTELVSCTFVLSSNGVVVDEYTAQ